MKLTSAQMLQGGAILKQIEDLQEQYNQVMGGQSPVSNGEGQNGQNSELETVLAAMPNFTASAPVGSGVKPAANQQVTAQATTTPEPVVQKKRRMKAASRQAIVDGQHIRWALEKKTPIDSAILARHNARLVAKGKPEIKV